MIRNRSKIILIIYIMVIFLQEYETARDGTDSDSDETNSSFSGWDSYSESESSTNDEYPPYLMKRMHGWSPFNENAESSSGGLRLFRVDEEGNAIVEEPVPIEEVPKSCFGWIMYGLHPHQSIWRVGYWSYTAKYGSIRSDDFCHKFGKHVPVTKYLTTMESTEPCYGWIHFVGYHSGDKGQKNKQIAELRYKKKLDLFISDWPFKYSLYLIDPKNKNKLLSPIDYCSQILGYEGDHLPPISADHELLIQQYLPD